MDSKSPGLHLFAQKIYRAVEKITHTENGTKITEINIHTSKKYIQSETNILLGFSIIKNAHYKKFGKRKKRIHSEFHHPEKTMVNTFAIFSLRNFILQFKKNCSHISYIQSYVLWNRIITQNTLP